MRPCEVQACEETFLRYLETGESGGNDYETCLRALVLGECELGYVDGPAATLWKKRVKPLSFLIECV
jgi:hypothetical protein